MKKTLIAGLASLMLAGVISAAQDLGAVKDTHNQVLLGEGSAPIPATGLLLVPANESLSIH